MSNNSQPAKPPPGGHVRAYRAEMNEPVWRSAELWHLWSWCKFKAAYEPKTISVKTGRGETLVDLQPGQFLFGRRSASDELGPPAKTIEDRLKKLEELGKITRQPARHFTIVTVCDVEVYNGRLADSGPPTRQPSAQQPPTNRPPTRHKEEQDNLNNVDNGFDHKESRSWNPELEQTVVQRARELGKVARPAEEHVQRRADIDLLLRIAYLREVGAISEDAIVQGLESIRQHNGHAPQNPVAYFRTVLDDRMGHRLSRLTKGVVLPASLLDRLVSPPQPG